MSDDRDEIERIIRGSARYVFYVDVGKMSPEKAQDYLRKVKRRLKGKNSRPGLDNDTFI